MARVTNESIKRYLRKRVDVFRQHEGDPRINRGEYAYQAAVAPMIIRGAMGTDKTAAIKELADEMGLGYIELHADELKDFGLEELEQELKKRGVSDKDIGYVVFEGVMSVASDCPYRVAAYNILDSGHNYSFRNFYMPDKWTVIVVVDDIVGGDYTALEPAFLSRGAVFDLAE